MKLRNISAMNRINDAAHSRSLIDSIMIHELIVALRDWTKADAGGALIGAVALSFHVRPRMTQDLDFLFLDETSAPDQVSGFSRITPVLFRHDRTGVDVNVLTPSAIRAPMEVAQEVARTAIVSDGVPVASERGLVALKLFRSSFQDRADIVALIKTGRVEFSGFRLSIEQMSAFRELVDAAATDRHPP
jgi:hypothetical protein